MVDNESKERFSTVSPLIIPVNITKQDVKSDKFCQLCKNKKIPPKSLSNTLEVNLKASLKFVQKSLGSKMYGLHNQSLIF